MLRPSPEIPISDEHLDASIESRDGIYELSRPVPKTSLLKVVLFAIALLANAAYLLFIVNPIHADNLPFFVVTAVADVIAIVIFSSTWVVCLYFEVLKDRYYREIADLRRDGHHLLDRRVAVFVPVVNEDLDLIRNTILCLWSLRGNKRIYLLDDGRRSATSRLAAEMKVGYVTREGNAFFKAGNLNNALRLIQEEFVVVVDADFALHPRFLEATLPLFHDPAIAAVQTPQIYSNEETLFAKGSRYLQAVFYRYLQPGRNLLDSSFCVGTNVIYRTSALREVGGIAEVHHSEDVFTTLKFLEVGRKVFFLDEPLAVGLGPATLIAVYNQQFRWARGGLTMMFRHNTLLNRRLQPDQRLQFFLSNFFYLSGIAVAIYLISPLVAIILNVKPISDAYFWQWLPLYALYFVTNFVFFISFAPKNRLYSLVLGMFSYLPYLAALCSVLLGLPHFNWKPTNSHAKGLITTLLAPYIVYVVVALATGVMIAIGAIGLRASFAEYYFWLGIDTVIACVFIVHSYLAQPAATLPVFDIVEPSQAPRISLVQQGGLSIP
jgi:cellulose synthase (UDP-forming)